MYWYESMIMVILYLGYIVVMVVNPQLESWAHATKTKFRTKVFPVLPSESTPLHTSSKGIQVKKLNMTSEQNCTIFSMEIDLPVP